MAAVLDSTPSPADRDVSTVQPRWVRIVHWINALAFLTMLFSGWQVYKADPYWFDLPGWWPTLGGDLPGALQWHFSAMWLLSFNGIVAVASLLATGRFRHLYIPVRATQLWRDLKALISGRVDHQVVNERSAVQKVAYMGVILLLLLETLSGLSIWKPVQLHWLTACLGGYESARRVHFVVMALLASFVTGHMILALAAPKLLLAMLGIRRLPKDGRA
jgi:thiosulfate reductase cytochrome b subunit